MSLSNVLRSPVGKKFVTGITGLGLVIFVLMHMIGNLSMFSGDDAYNEYAHFLASLGPLLYAVEAGLVLFFLFHAITGVRIWIGKRKARPQGYDMYRSAGSPSLQSSSSRSMAITGIILLVFTVFHLISFKFGPGGPGNGDPAYMTVIDGVEMRNLALLVREKFATTWYTLGYTAIMLLLVVHLRHGVWSALQSLGAMRPSITPAVYTIGGLLGLGIGLGFIAMPLALYLGWI
ncbi:MAG: succinate dehydrogenase cytochrome b subunit [Bacteroidetes bacterium]|nr:succinate dehydrogenase cytochrome b subunit [Bacteroidota bacterium]MDA1333571.1 succinate dehydrogenase cytochrome b subunit [Bacteroidota bacterium]